MSNILTTPITIANIKRICCHMRDKMFPYRGLPAEHKYRKRSIAEALNTYLYVHLVPSTYKNIMVLQDGPDTAYVVPRLDCILEKSMSEYSYIHIMENINYNLVSFFNDFMPNVSYACKYIMLIEKLAPKAIKAKKYLRVTREEIIHKGFFVVCLHAKHYVDEIKGVGEQIIFSINQDSVLSKMGVPSSLFKATYSVNTNLPVFDICPALLEPLLEIAKRFLDDTTLAEYKKYCLKRFATHTLASSREVDALYPVITVKHPVDWVVEYTRNKNAMQIRADRNAECASTINEINTACDLLVRNSASASIAISARHHSINPEHEA